MAVKTISYAASDIGKHRSSNQDSGYAGYQLFFVADGMGGHAGGDIASAISSQRVALTDSRYESVEEAIDSFKKGILEANGMLSLTVADHPELEGMGTTFSGILLHGTQMVTAHIGDSRIYLARDGEVKQITNDHTFVQKLVDMGRITPEEALVHPRRSVLMRVLGDVSGEPEIDIALHDALPGDRWLLCSDGLSGVVPENVMDRILTSKIPTEEVAELLVGEALEFGAPDNVTVVIVDIVRPATKTDFEPGAHFVGSAANEVVIEERKGGKILRLFSPRNLFELLQTPEDPTQYAPESEELLNKILMETRRKIRWRSIRIVASWFLVAGMLAGMGYLAYQYTQTRYYVDVYQGQVTIFQGIRESLGPLKFSKPFMVSEISLEDLEPFQQTLIERSISAESLEDAERILQQLSESNDE
ncbi:serine/threonine-protein phosphatase [Aquiluna borgnonia]|uniref:Serine/threonine-protein phosphatase n=1 Tax=Aquiluna borgnonia TaxID=2499157 RepID=A0A7D4TL45_9MICO|nr:PP2C family serine/threonine-protein phosphatase [Aquiluna borgnonia]QKJ25852.1 serine/threonine-protein phosphatase [Aquiluna borgnonia]